MPRDTREAHLLLLGLTYVLLHGPALLDHLLLALDVLALPAPRVATCYTRHVLPGHVLPAPRVHHVLAHVPHPVDALLHLVGPAAAAAQEVHHEPGVVLQHEADQTCKRCLTRPRLFVLLSLRG